MKFLKKAYGIGFKFSGHLEKYAVLVKVILKQEFLNKL